MKSTRKVLALSAIASALVLSLGHAQANTVTSNDPLCAGAPTGRTFSVTATTVVHCLLKGTGNISGSGDAINLLAPGWTTLDKSDGGGDLLEGTLTGSPSLTSGLSGTFNIAASVYSAYSRIVIAFKSGTGQLDPDWAAFELAANTLTGSWAITTGTQSLSHAAIYGIRNGGTPPIGTPEPATLALVGLGLLGAAALRRRRS